jgi:hypothetical protein
MRWFERCAHDTKGTLFNSYPPRVTGGIQKLSGREEDAPGGVWGRHEGRLRGLRTTAARAWGGEPTQVGLGAVGLLEGRPWARLSGAWESPGVALRIACAALAGALYCAMMMNAAIAVRRLQNQHLAAPALATPGEVVAWFGAVQAQDYLGALWAIGQRMPQASESAVEQAMAAGVIVRTHPMRGTWHFVAADDVRWLLALKKPRNLSSVAAWYRRLELDEATIAKSLAVFAQALAGGQQRTRQELAAAHAQAGISTAGLRLTFLLSRAEAEGLICSGPRRGKQFTYALLDEIAPSSQMLRGDEAVAELARRYFTSHGPATVQDFAWWSGLTTAETKRGLHLVQSALVKEAVNGQEFWQAAAAPAAIVAASTAYLLPSYDEYTVAYRDRSAVLDPAYAAQTGNGIFSPVIVVDGRVLGIWSRAFAKNQVTLTTTLFEPLSAAQEQALAAAKARYSAFLGKTLLIISAGIE